MQRLKQCLARWGAPGGAARWAMRGYQAIRQHHPDRAAVPDGQVFAELIAVRYRRFANPVQQAQVSADFDEQAGLMGVVVTVLKVEAALAENTPDAVLLMLTVIAEELAKGGLSHEAIYGRHMLAIEYLPKVYGIDADAHVAGHDPPLS